MATRYCGLDFGTSNSTLALSADGRSFLCPLEGDSVLLPSAVFYDAEDHSVRFGRDAIRNYVEGVEGRLLRALKSVLGSTLIEETTLIQRKRVAMRAIIGMFIRHLKRTAEAHLAAIGMPGPLDSVVLGRPVHFVDGDEEADRRAEAELVAAAKAEGFRHVETQLEPIAAALAYEQSLDREELSLIVDLGGGTSDFVIARLSPERARQTDRAADILGRSGVHIGGTDFDRRLSIDKVMPYLGYDVLLGEKRLPMPQHLFHDLATWHKIPFLYTAQNLHYLRSIVLTADRPELLRRLIDVLAHRNGHRIAGEVEAAKIALSDAARVSFALPLEPPVAVDMTRADVDRAVHDDTTRLIAAIARCTAAASVKPEQIQSVFLTGGSTAIPAVRDRILGHLPNARAVPGDMFGSVGLGLAIDAQRRFG
ncbi:Hsp70 family protein [Dongia sedimenti]|uniref:Hsp70 family protein n=1 Tax=Dongia sedimenti TaxID=3064282 RepID=A0ABU0YLQ2_9PROT|nr:Hsp70 family protein [Rhodospirillaceae bacterium R-7]